MRSFWTTSISPPNTTMYDYTPEFCATLERRYWRNLHGMVLILLVSLSFHLSYSAVLNAHTAGSLFTEETELWNVAHLQSALSRLLPSSTAVPGVNTLYLYFGMWRATFAWHVEDMDLFSRISTNYIYFGARKFWYAIPQAKSVQLENTMRSMLMIIVLVKRIPLII